MKRRSLLLGLGAATLGSAAAALTGATLSNTVAPTADLRVNVDGGLEVKAATSNPTEDTRSIGAPSFVDLPESALTGGFPSPSNNDPANDVTFDAGEIPAAAAGRTVDFQYVLSNTPAEGAGFGTGSVGRKVAANAKTNDEFELAMNVDLPAQDEVFEAPTAIALTNKGSRARDIAVTYTFGKDVNPAGVTQGDVARIYEFVDVHPRNKTETQLSPVAASPTGPGTALTIGAGETYLLDLRVNLDFESDNAASIRSAIDQQVSDGGEVTLLESITVGTP